MTAFHKLCRLGVALTVVLLVTLWLQPSVHHTPNGDVTKQTVSATPVAALDADDVESGTDVHPSGPLAQSRVHGPERSTSFRPAFCILHTHGRHTLHLTKHLRC